MIRDYNEAAQKISSSAPITILGLLTLLIIFGTLIGLALILLVAEATGVSMDTITAAGETQPAEHNFIRWSALINHLSMFVLPAIATALFLFRRHWQQFLKINRCPDAKNIGLGTLFIICAMPLAQFAFWLNRQLPLPSWAHQMEDSTNALIEGLLAADHPGILLFNILVIAVIPALGEELVFRGILQSSLARLFRNTHLAIWVAAFLFSAFHMQFEGFLARLVLGAVLGYLFYWTRNLWVPIIAHFMNNALQILAQYFFQQELDPSNLDAMEMAPWTITVLSAILVFFIGKQLIRHNQKIDDSAAFIPPTT